MIDKKSIQMIKSFASPPKLVATVLTGCFILLEDELVKDGYDKNAKIEDDKNYWKSAFQPV